jgi:methanogenic corrinoid protein MtbC1
MGSAVKNKMSKSADQFSIRQVIDLTGLSEFTMRGWENRYGAFNPERSSTGRRIYSHSDLEKAILLRELTLRHHRIGDIAQLSVKNLQALLEDVPDSSNRPPGPFHDRISHILKNLSLQAWDEIEKELRRLMRKDDVRKILTELVAPLLQELGQMVAAGKVNIAQEHIFSSLLKERIYVLMEAAKKTQKTARFVVAAPEGDFHELGILVAHTMTVHSGFKSLYLGPNSPKKDLCETALRFGASHVLIGSTISRKEGAKEDLFSYLHFLERNLSRDVTIWLGGRNKIDTGREIQRKIAHFSSLMELDKALHFVGRQSYGDQRSSTKVSSG